MLTAQTVARLRRVALSPRGSALVGGVVWGTALMVLRPGPFDTAWAHALLMLAPLVLVPLALRLVAPPAETRGLDWGWRVVIDLQLPAALLLGWGFLLPQGTPAAVLSIPWLATTGLLGLLGLTRAWRHRREPLRELCVDAGLVYLAIGSFWAVLDRWGLRPLDFKAVIVLLTAIHFHYAGFALPVLTGVAMRQVDGYMPRLAGVGVIVAVPLVAAGITATQLNFGSWLESMAAWLMASAGVLSGGLYFRLAMQPAWPLSARGLWVVSALSISFSMVLAAMYGSRFFFPIVWLDIPWMRALHGTANALGFGLAGVISWMLADVGFPHTGEPCVKT